MTLPKSLTTVTTFSKILAMILFLLLPFAGFYLGYQYRKGAYVASPIAQQTQTLILTPAPSQTLINSDNSTTNWKTLSTEYHNADPNIAPPPQIFSVNFSFKHPPNYRIISNSIATNDSNLGENLHPNTPGAIAAMGLATKISTPDGQKTKLGGKNAYRQISNYPNHSLITYTVPSMSSKEGFNISFQFICSFFPKNGIDASSTCDLMASTLKFIQ